jgi:hypothetical protein
VPAFNVFNVKGGRAGHRKPPNRSVCALGQRQRGICMVCNSMKKRRSDFEFDIIMFTDGNWHGPVLLAS